MQIDLKMKNENTITLEKFGELAGLNFAKEENPTPELPTTFNEEEDTQDTPPINEEEETPPTKETTDVDIFEEESEAYKVSQFLIKSGQLEDIEVEIDGESFKLSDAKNLDEETFKEVLKVYNSEKEESLKKDKVDVSDLNTVQQKLINIIKDGDYTKAKELFQNPDILKEPFQGYDPTNQLHNEEVFIKDLIARNPKITEKKALALLEIEKADGTLDETAQAIVNEYRENFIKGLEEKENETKKQKEERIKQEKQFIKDLNSIYKQMEVKDSIALQMTKLVQRDKEGNRPIESLIEESLSDPSKASDLVLFLSNKELYDKKVSAKVKNETEVGFAKKISIVKTNKPVVTEEPKEEKEKSFKEAFGNIKLK